MASHHFRWLENTGCDQILNVSTINNGGACRSRGACSMCVWVDCILQFTFTFWVKHNSPNEMCQTIQNYLNPFNAHMNGWGEFSHKSSTLKKPYMDRYRFDDFSSSLLLNAFLLLTLNLIFSMVRAHSTENGDGSSSSSNRSDNENHSKIRKLNSIANSGIRMLILQIKSTYAIELTVCRKKSACIKWPLVLHAVIYIYIERWNWSHLSCDQFVSYHELECKCKWELIHWKCGTKEIVLIN